jgi:hypothetical protein
MEERQDILHASKMAIYASVHKDPKAGDLDGTVFLPKWGEKAEEEKKPKQVERKSSKDLQILLKQALLVSERQYQYEQRRKGKKET